MPKIKVEFITVLPIKFPKFIPSCLVITAFMPNTNSGSEVPMATKTSPIKTNGNSRPSAISVAVFTTPQELIKSMAIAATNINKSLTNC